MNTLKRQFAVLSRVKASESWKQDARNRLIADIRFYSFNKPSSLRFFKMRSVAQMVTTIVNPFAWMQSGAALVLVVMIALGGSVASVGATLGSLPGDTLYPVKRTIENVQIVFSPSDEGKARIHLALASRRADEFYALTERIQNSPDESKTSQKAEKALEEVERQVKIAQSAVLKVTESELDQKKKDTIAKELSLKTAHIEGVIDQAVNALSQNLSGILEEKAVQVQQDVRRSELYRIETMASLVEDPELLSSMLAPKKELLHRKIEEAVLELQQGLLPSENIQELTAEARALSAFKSGESSGSVALRKSFGLPEKPLDIDSTVPASFILERQERAISLVKELEQLKEALAQEGSVDVFISIEEKIEQGMNQADEIVADLTRFASILGVEDPAVQGTTPPEDQQPLSAPTTDKGVVKGITLPSNDQGKSVSQQDQPQTDTDKMPQDSKKTDKETGNTEQTDPEKDTNEQVQQEPPQDPIPPAI